MKASDKELDAWLEAWRVPPAPGRLEAQVRNAYRRKHGKLAMLRRLLTGRVHLPVPALAVALVVALGLPVLAWQEARRAGIPPTIVSLVMPAPVPALVPGPSKTPKPTSARPRDRRAVSRNRKDGQAGLLLAAKTQSGACGMSTAEWTHTGVLVYHPELYEMEMVEVYPSPAPALKPVSMAARKRTIAETCKLNQIAAVQDTARSHRQQ